MRTEIGPAAVESFLGDEPAHWERLRAGARLLEEYDHEERDGVPFGAAFWWRAGGEQPSVVVTQRANPGPGSGCVPGVLVVPETAVVFVGAGARLLAYDLVAGAKLWEDLAFVGFWGWARHGAQVLMSAELELGAWSLSAERLWRVGVEPPWHYSVAGDVLRLNVLGVERAFSVSRGPGS